MGIDEKWELAAFCTNVAEGEELKRLLWVTLLSLAQSLFPLGHTTSQWFSGSNKKSECSELPLAFLASKMTLVRWEVRTDSSLSKKPKNQMECQRHFQGKTSVFIQSIIVKSLPSCILCKFGCLEKEIGSLGVHCLEQTAAWVGWLTPLSSRSQGGQGSSVQEEKNQPGQTSLNYFRNLNDMVFFTLITFPDCHLNTTLDRKIFCHIWQKIDQVLV